jgi:hypothetical protein
MKCIRVFAASVVAIGLYTASAGAQLNGTIQGLSQGQVVCINSTDTGVGTILGSLTAGSFNCGQLSLTPGDNVTIVIAGSVGEGGEETGCSIPPVPEQEPNNLATPQEYQNLGALPSKGCVTAEGTITAGSGPDPSNPALNADQDVYAIVDLTGISQLEFDLISNGKVFYHVFDARTGDSLITQCSGSLPCIFPVPTGGDAMVGVRVRGEKPITYTFNLLDATTGGLPSPSAARSLNLPTSEPRDWLQNMR